MPKLHIDVWSDVACPWCWVGKRRLEAALAKFPHKGQVEVVWRAFELDPSAPAERDTSVSNVERLAQKYGMTVAQAKQRQQQLVDVARADGLELELDRLRSGNTFDAHRLIHLAGKRGLQDAMKERLFRAYFTEGAAVGDRETLVRLAVELGIDADEAQAALQSDAHADEVRAEEGEARDLGVRGVPFFVLGGKYALSGAQPAEVFGRALEQAWTEVAARPEPFSDGAACGPDGCD
ncbi:MAG: DsbA family oxidoreductase [Polyangiaceae bacterium]